MKKLLFLSILLTVPAEARQIVLDISDRDIAIVENYVLDAEQWIKEAWAGQVNKRSSQMIDEEIRKSIENQEAIPAGEAAIIDKALSRPDYKSRQQREEIAK
jgi:hypothetical protein